MKGSINDYYINEQKQKNETAQTKQTEQLGGR